MTRSQHKNKVFVGIPLSSSVHAEFFRTFYPAHYLLPEEGESHVYMRKWGNAVSSRNEIVKSFLETDCSHLFFMDSDMVFPENTLSRLLYHDKDIIGGFYTLKHEPYNSTCFVKENDDELEWHTYNPKPEETIKQVTALGTGCMLIKRSVFEAMTWPFFYYRPIYELEKFTTEDVTFCEIALEKGFEVWCDFTIKCGHIGNMVVTPFMENNESKVRINAV